MTQLENAPASQEDAQARYARQTRNAVVLIAWVVAITALFTVIGGLIAVVDLAHVEHSLNSVSVNTSPTCSNDPSSPLPNC